MQYLFFILLLKPSPNRKLQLKQPEGGQLVQQLQKRNIRIRDFIVAFICNSIATRLPSFMTDTWSQQGKISIHQYINTGPVRINRRQITNCNHYCNIYKQNPPPSGVKPEKNSTKKGKNRGPGVTHKFIFRVIMRIVIKRHYSSKVGRVIRASCPTGKKSSQTQ